jgi:Lon protease-like protein
VRALRRAHAAIDHGPAQARRRKVQAGNARYANGEDLPDRFRCFRSTAALLLPGGRMPLNIFEPRYLEMIDHASSHQRLVGMVQPRLDGAVRGRRRTRTVRRRMPRSPDVVCRDRRRPLSDRASGRLPLPRRFRGKHAKTPFRQCRIKSFAPISTWRPVRRKIDRPALLKAFRAYLKANDLDADWESVSRAENAMLVNALSMMAPYGAAEKQALLEAPDLKTRAETLIAITEIALARDDEDFGSSLQ